MVVYLGRTHTRHAIGIEIYFSQGKAAAAAILTSHDEEVELANPIQRLYVSLISYLKILDLFFFFFDFPIFIFIWLRFTCLEKKKSSKVWLNEIEENHPPRWNEIVKGF